MYLSLFMLETITKKKNERKKKKWKKKESWLKYHQVARFIVEVYTRIVNNIDSHLAKNSQQENII